MIVLATKVIFRSPRFAFLKFGFIECMRDSDAMRIAKRHWPKLEDDEEDVQVVVWELDEGMRILNRHFACWTKFDPTLPRQ
jgi:hypothetical protein